MADTAVEINASPVVEKVVSEEVDAVKKDEKKDDAENEATSTENGANVETSEAKENGDAVPDSDVSNKAADDVLDDAVETAEVENGEEEANGDSTDSAPAEAVKRKVNEAEAKPDENNTATPEKKAKLEEPTKDDVPNGAEASEVAA